MCREKMKVNIMRVICIIIALSAMFTVALVPVDAAESGQCGSDLSWTLNAGTLTISGEGAMDDYYDSHFAPWYEFRNDIVRIVLSDKLTRIGSFAFYGCKSVKAVVVPDSVQTIGNYAFASCEKLEMVDLGIRVSSIGKAAFYNCFALRAVRLPFGLENIGSQAFYRCESLYTIEVPQNLKTMGDSAFAYCKSLVRAQIHARLDQLPAWTFYGCENLTEVAIAETVSEIDNFAFKNCEGLTSVHFPGDEETADKLTEQIIVDNPVFSVRGALGKTEITPVSYAGQFIENEDNTHTQINITVQQNDKVTLVHTVNNTYKPESDEKGTYSVDLTLTLENNDAWESALEQTKDAFSYINNIYSSSSEVEDVTLSVYMKDDTTVSQDFLDEMADRDVKLNIVAPNGATWRIESEDIKTSVDTKEPPKLDFSHTVEEAPSDICESMGTDDCYKLTFDTSTEVNAEVLVQLPPTTAVNGNAYLYQIEEDGDYTKIQAVAVDDDGNAHFYVASVNKDVEYVIGVNVPGESTDDVIIPDELMTRYGSAIERLEIIEYAHLGRETPSGLNLGQVMLIVIGAIVVTSIVVGAIMFMMNKKKNQQYRPA